MAEDIIHICISAVPQSIAINFGMKLYKAFLRILCVCCPRKLRRKYQPQLRSKQSQFRSTRRYYSSSELQGIQQIRQNSCEQTYI
ncbi:unnamed protein product [Plutella xylostella]|uniref:(diamondback moth) hypothetical protein n=1 Tax=Plutella xylostella TaxID=51655 RepID=A0A8S4EAS4_PLUXY|nr:unnamed protein product [Plutella xylostella]